MEIDFEILEKECQGKGKSGYKGITDRSSIAASVNGHWQECQQSKEIGTKRRYIAHTTLLLYC